MRFKTCPIPRPIWHSTLKGASWRPEATAGQSFCGDLKTGRQVASCDTALPLSWIIFSADGTRLIAAAAAARTVPKETLQESVLHFSVSDGKLIREQSCPLDGAYGRSPSPDGALFAAPTRDGTTLRLLSTSDGKELRRTAGKANIPAEVRFSGDGRFLTASSGDGVVRVWRASDGKVAHEFKALPGGVARVALSHDGKLLAAAGPADDAIHIWDLEKSKELHAFGGHRSGPLSVVFSKDGKSVFTTNRAGVFSPLARASAEWSLREWNRRAARSGASPKKT